jgi:hypothetical protein
MHTLAEAIEQVYAAFADTPKPRVIEGCPHCLDAKKVDTLLATPLRQLKPDELSSYASSAFLTVGSVADYLYLLPRILEISATDDSWWPDIEVTGRAIASSQVNSWPASRRTALHNLLLAVVANALASQEYRRLDCWICAIARMDIPVAPYLDQIAEVPAAVLAYFDDNADCLPYGKLCNAFWEPGPRHEEVVEWFRTEKVANIVFVAYGYTFKVT